jgi:hypothetical protein
MTKTTAFAALAAFLLAAAPAIAQPGSEASPISVHFRRGGDAIRFTGVLRQGQQCCSYRFNAEAGQVLNWRETGATIRVVMKYPDGHIDGPGLPQAIALPQTGTYVFTISPNLMADGAFGPFTLRLQIPPLGERG